MIPCDSIPSEVTWKNCTGTEGYTGVIGLCRVENVEQPCDPQANGLVLKTSQTRLWCSQEVLSVVISKESKGAWLLVGKHRELRSQLCSSWRQTRNLPTLLHQLHSSLFEDSETKCQPDCEPLSLSFLHLFVQNFHILNLPSVQQEHMGGVYVLSVSTKSKDDTVGGRIQLIQNNQIQNVLATTETMVRHNHVSILWQVPQYVIITAGEVLFSITGLEFAYSEAAPQLKSVVQALWLFTTAIGDLIVVVIITLNLFSDLVCSACHSSSNRFVSGGANVRVQCHHAACRRRVHPPRRFLLSIRWILEWSRRAHREDDGWWRAFPHLNNYWYFLSY